MSEATAGSFDVSEPIEMDLGGLRFSASFRAPAGATLRVYGEVDGHDTELLRFDDFIEDPHYHVPAAAAPLHFDQANGEPLAWYVAQVRDHLAELLDAGGFSALASSVDVAAVAAHADDIRRAMEECVPEGYARVPGAGLQAVESS